MHPLPKSAAEILATAKRASQKKEIRPRKSKTERSQPLKDRLSTLNFSRHTISDIQALSTAGSSSSLPPDVRGRKKIQFKDLTTPQTFNLEAALEIEEGRDLAVEELPDIIHDELFTTRVPLIFSI